MKRYLHEEEEEEEDEFPPRKQLLSQQSFHSGSNLQQDFLQHLLSQPSSLQSHFSSQASPATTPQQPLLPSFTSTLSRALKAPLAGEDIYSSTPLPMNTSNQPPLLPSLTTPGQSLAQHQHFPSSHSYTATTLISQSGSIAPTSVPPSTVAPFSSASALTAFPRANTSPQLQLHPQFANEYLLMVQEAQRQQLQQQHQQQLQHQQHQQHQQQLQQQQYIYGLPATQLAGPTRAPIIRTTNSPYSKGLFVLEEQPSTRQRKSYSDDIRYILPHPLRISMRELYEGEVAPRILVGTVTVQLADRDGKVENMRTVLHSVGGTTKPLSRQNAADFSLMIFDNKGGNKFRLVFTVSYQVSDIGTNDNNNNNNNNGGIRKVTEVISTRAFTLYSSGKRQPKQKTQVANLNPQQGAHDKETEVWIKGRFILDKDSPTTVHFGDFAATVVEQSENLITVIAPSRPDLTKDQTVAIRASNAEGEFDLHYTYCVPQNENNDNSNNNNNVNTIANNDNNGSGNTNNNNNSHIFDPNFFVNFGQQ